MLFEHFVLNGFYHFLVLKQHDLLIIKLIYNLNSKMNENKMCQFNVLQIHSPFIYLEFMFFKLHFPTQFLSKFKLLLFNLYYIKLFAYNLH